MWLDLKMRRHGCIKLMKEPRLGKALHDFFVKLDTNTYFSKLQVDYNLNCLD